MVIHGGGEGVYEEGEDDEKEPLVLRVERVKAPQPHQGILRVRLYAVGQGDVLGEEENLWHEEVGRSPFSTLSPRSAETWRKVSGDFSS